MAIAFLFLEGDRFFVFFTANLIQKKRLMWIKLANAPGNVLLVQGDGNLSRDSVVNISQILTVNKTDLTPASKIGKLSAEKIESIIAGLQIIFWSCSAWDILAIAREL